MKNLGLIIAAVAVATLSGCASVKNASTEKQKSIELYRVFDIQTKADRYQVADAASDGLGANVSSANEQSPIVMGEKPDKPGRFKPSNLGAGIPNQVGGMMQLAMQMNSSFTNRLKTAECEGAVWTATAQRNVENAFDMSFNLCLWEYQGGYALDVYANYTKKEGGGFLGMDGLVRKAAYAISGTPEAWAEKTVLDVVREIKTRNGGEVKYVEGYPALETTPRQDSGEVFNSEGYLAPAPISTD